MSKKSSARGFRLDCVCVHSPPAHPPSEYGVCVIDLGSLWHVPEQPHPSHPSATLRLVDVWLPIFAPAPDSEAVDSEAADGDGMLMLDVCVSVRVCLCVCLAAGRVWQPSPPQAT